MPAEEPDPVAMPDAPAIVTLASDGRPPDEFRNAVLALGNFDGVHRGHGELARVARALGERLGRPALALTFEPHPRTVFRPDQPVFRLTPLPLKAELLAGAGLGATLVLPFDRVVAATTAESFVDDLLLGRLGAAGLVCGYDFHFGKSRVGSPEFLVERAGSRGVPVSVVPSFSWRDRPVSSTLVREALADGDPARAADLLGRFWSVRGEIRHGDKRGRELGFPTANLHLAPDCALRFGIYAVRMKLDGVWRDGVASFGTRPTFDDGAPRLETFLFDFSGDLYSRTVDVALIGWLRGEEKFDALDALIAQMERDSAGARTILAGTPAFLP